MSRCDCGTCSLDNGAGCWHKAAPLIYRAGFRRSFGGWTTCCGAGENGMWRKLASWTTTLTLALAGCASGPLQENPLLLGMQRPLVTDNPVYLPNGGMDYGAVFEKVIDTPR